MKSITGSILAGFGMLSLVMLKVNTSSYDHFNPFNGSGFSIPGHFFFYPWVFIAGILPVVAIVAGIVLMFLGFKEKKVE